MQRMCETSQIFLLASLSFLMAIITHPFEKGVKDRGFYRELFRGWKEVICLGLED